ncbi:MAG: VCBS repeat-containing protein, partial [Bacteroidia bacterium]|nr:VCBS repeat-containing protein [Bacteroidia bacterium]
MKKLTFCILTYAICILHFAFFLTGMGFAQTAGDLDSTFGTNGIVTTDFSSSNDQGNSVALQTDGKILVCGGAGLGTNFLLARYNPDGTLDNTFDYDGKVITPIGENAIHLAIQPDGKILVCGDTDPYQASDWVIVRYNINGGVDSTFGINGIVITDFNGCWDGTFAGIFVLSDGKIIVGGIIENCGNTDFGLVRYNSDGTLDITFGTNGKVTTAISDQNDNAYAMTMQADGKIIMAGNSAPSNTDIELVRYNPDGTLDTTFNGTGKVTTDISGGNDYGDGVAVQTDGKIIIGGYLDNGTNYDFVLARYNTDGTLDNTFNSDGKVIIDFNNTNEYCEDLIIQPDGKIITVGSFHNGSNYDILIVRFNADGTLDSIFGTNGKVVLPLGSGDDRGCAATLQSDGKIIVAGASYNGTNNDFAVVRLINTICNNEVTLINENFESYSANTFPSAGGWVLQYNGAGNSYQVVVDSVAYTGTKSMQVKGQVGWCAEMYIPLSQTPDIIYFEAYAMTTNISGGLAFLNHSEGTWGTTYAGLGFANDSILAGGGSLPDYYLYKANSNEWYKLKLKYDVINEQVTVWINDTLRGENLQCDFSANGYIEFGILECNGAFFYIDNIRVWYEQTSVTASEDTICAGSSTTLTASGGVSYLWSTSETTASITVNPSTTTTYTVAITTSEGCNYTDSVTITANTCSCLVAYYPFNGNANDESGNGNDGTVNGATLTTDRFGNANSAYSFDGGSDYITIPDTTILNITGNITIESWIYQTEFTGVQSYSIVCKGETSVDRIYYLYTNASTNHAYLILENTVDTEYSVESVNQVPLNTWTHLVGVLENGIMKIYINGVLENTNNFSGSLKTNNTDLYIGYYYYTALDHSYFSGILDDIRIYNCALSDAEIDSLYHEGGWGFETQQYGWNHWYYDYQGTSYNPNASSNQYSPLTSTIIEQWNNPSSGYMLTGDVNGDGKLEVFIFTLVGDSVIRLLNNNGIELWHRNVETDAGISGGKTGGADLTDMTGDGYPEILVGVYSGSSGSNMPSKVLVYDSTGTVIKTINIPNNWQLVGVRGVDLGTDGKKIVVQYYAGFPGTPRRIAVYDYITATLNWEYDFPLTGGWYLPIDDINNNDTLDIVTSGFAPSNGTSANGYTDGNTYVIGLSGTGTNLWGNGNTQVGGKGSSSLAISDLDNNGNKEIVSVFDVWSANDKVLILTDSGTIIYNYDLPASSCGFCGIADIIGTTDKEILVGCTNGNIYMFDDTLNLLDQVNIGSSYTYHNALNDINGDGNIEIITRSGTDLKILDINLDILWSKTLPANINWIIVSDIISGGSPEILVSSDKIYCFRLDTCNISVLITSSTNVSCNGGSDGSATATALGGVLPYTYSWNTTPPQTTATAIVLSAGTYIVTVTDSAGCQSIDSVEITEPEQLIVTLGADIAICSGNTATLTATVSGGTSPYNYLWNTGCTDMLWHVSTGGTFGLTVTDANGCTASDDIILNLLPLP